MAPGVSQEISNASPAHPKANETRSNRQRRPILDDMSAPASEAPASAPDDERHAVPAPALTAVAAAATAVTGRVHHEDEKTRKHKDRLPRRKEMGTPSLTSTIFIAEGPPGMPVTADAKFGAIIGMA